MRKDSISTFRPRRTDVRPMAVRASSRAPLNRGGQTEAEARGGVRYGPARRVLKGTLLLLSVPLWAQAAFPSWSAPRLTEGILPLGLFCVICLAGTWLLDMKSNRRGRDPILPAAMRFAGSKVPTPLHQKEAR